MMIRGKLQKSVQSLRQRIEKAFRSETTRTLLKSRSEILEQIKTRIIVDPEGNPFPYEKVSVWLHPPSGALREAFKSTFLQGDSLKTEILGVLKDSGARLPDPFEIVVKLQPDRVFNPVEPVLQPLFQLDFVKSRSPNKREVPETTFTISKGLAEQTVYHLKRERILIGRVQEVLDREGWMVRKNDIVFLDNKNEINSTVNRAHARIWFDFEKMGFFIMDEVSRNGTTIVREGLSIEAPAGNHHGILLQSGDVIYCGQACMKFEEPEASTASGDA